MGTMGTELERRRADYRRRTRWLTAILLFVWLAVTLGASYFARELDRLSFFGFPLGFYMAAQGALLIYLLIVGVYALLMDRIEAHGGVAAPDDDS